MSYGITPYRINLERLSTRFGNTNTAKRWKVRSSCNRRAGQIDAIDTDAPSLDQFALDLLDAKISHPGYGYKYWYALEAFMDELGARIPNRHWYPASADFFWNNDKFNLYDIDAPMSIPKPDDFPVVFVLRAANMTDELKTDLENGIEDADQLAELKSWIADAKRYKQDLALFYY